VRPGLQEQDDHVLLGCIAEPALVRTLGLVEVRIAGMISRRLFQQTPSIRDTMGLVLVTVGIALLSNV
jgi:uncharacterized membrane protein